MKFICRKTFTLLILTIVTLISLSSAQTGGRLPYRYVNEPISITAYMAGDKSEIEVLGATVLASAYQDWTTRVSFTMDPPVPNTDYHQVNFVPSGDVISAVMTDGPALARCVFYSRGEAFLSPLFWRVAAFEPDEDAGPHASTAAMFCYRKKPNSRRVVLFVEFEDGEEQAIAIDGMQWGVSSTVFARKFRGPIDGLGAANVRRMALLEAPQQDTVCSVRVGEYAPEATGETFGLGRPLLTPVVGVIGVNCESELAFYQTQ